MDENVIAKVARIIDPGSWRSYEGDHPAQCGNPALVAESLRKAREVAALLLGNEDQKNRQLETALKELLEWVDEFEQTGKHPTYDAISPARKHVR